MDHLIDVSAAFLCLERGSSLAVYGTARKLSDLIKNILICVPKMNKGLTGLEQHEIEWGGGGGVINDRIIFQWTL